MSQFLQFSSILYPSILYPFKLNISGQNKAFEDVTSAIITRLIDNEKQLFAAIKTVQIVSLCVAAIQNKMSKNNKTQLQTFVNIIQFIKYLFYKFLILHIFPSFLHNTVRSKCSPTFTGYIQLKLSPQGKHTSIQLLLQVSESLFICTHFVLLQYDFKNSFCSGLLA